MYNAIKYFAATAAMMFAATASAETLTILATNDTHSQIDPGADGMGGVARRKVLIDSIRAEKENVILVDAGDAVQGSLFFTIYKGELEEKLMNALGYDIRILGNHEFDNGLQRLADNLAVADAELLCLNYDFAGTPLDSVFKPYTIREMGGKRIGFLPVNLNPKGMISKHNAKGVRYIPAEDAARHGAWWLKNIENVDYVVAVTHIGYQPETPPGDLDLVSRIPDIDLVLGGHSHTLVSPTSIAKNPDGRDIVVEQAGYGGKYLAEITVDLDSLGKTPEYKLIPVDARLDARVDPAVEEIVKPYRDIDLLYSDYVGRTAQAMPRKSNELLNFAADFVKTRGAELAPNIDLAIINKGGLRTDLPKGRISKGNIIDVMPFFNRVVVTDIKGSDLVPAFNQMAAVDGNGVSENVDITYDAGTDTCTEIIISGKPIDPDRVYRLATIDYLEEGGDYMPTLSNGTVVATSPSLLFEDVISYLSSPAMKGKKISASSRARMHTK